MWRSLTCKSRRRLPSRGLGLGSLCFLAGLMLGSAMDWSAGAQTANSAAPADPLSRDAVPSMIYAISSLAVDTEMAAIEIAAIDDRLDRIESELADRR